MCARHLDWDFPRNSASESISSVVFIVGPFLIFLPQPSSEAQRPFPQHASLTPRAHEGAAASSSMTFSSPFCIHHPSSGAAGRGRGVGSGGVCGVIHRSNHPSNMIHGTTAAAANSNDDPAPSIMPMVEATQLQGSSVAALVSFLFLLPLPSPPLRSLI